LAVSLSDRHYFALALIGYGLSALYSLFLYRRGFRQDNRVNYLLLACSFIPHSVAMFLRGFSLSRCPVNNLYEAMTFIMWTIVASYLVIGLWHRLRFLGAFASPFLLGMGIFALMPALDVRGPKPEFSNGMASLHASLILLSYGAFGVSFVASIMFLSQEHDLKFRKLRAVISLLPPIERLEKVINRMLVAGFILLTVGLALAPFIIGHSQAPVWRDPKTLWSAVLWLFYGALLAMRWMFSQGGRKFAWGAIGGFSFVLLTFWGFNLLSGLHHP
jgi:ABC-type transport system involved in cytochrome c biogenesis permease subunit